MVRRLALLFAGVLLLSAAAATLAAPQQSRPGLVGQARVFVENLGIGEAVPIRLIDVDTAKAVPTRVENPIALAPGSTVFTRQAGQTWQYKTINLPTLGGRDADLMLHGRDGWEAIGVVPEGNRVTVLFKRPGQAP